MTSTIANAASTVGSQTVNLANLANATASGGASDAPGAIMIKNINNNGLPPLNLTFPAPGNESQTIIRTGSSGTASSAVLGAGLFGISLPSFAIKPITTVNTTMTATSGEAGLGAAEVVTGTTATTAEAGTFFSAASMGEAAEIGLTLLLHANPLPSR